MINYFDANGNRIEPNHAPMGRWLALFAQRVGAKNAFMLMNRRPATSTSKIASWL
jgi:hypothetical protein